MPSSASNSLRLEEMLTGEQVNLWGILLNRVIAMLDAGIAGMATVALTGNYSLTSTNYVADEARNAILKFTGSVACTVTIPSVTKVYLVWNATTAAQLLTTGSGSTVTIDAGDIVLVFCDAVNVKTLSYGGLSIKDYIAATAASAGAVPSPLGNANKGLWSDGTNVTWRTPSVADIPNYATQTNKRALRYALIF